MHAHWLVETVAKVVATRAQDAFRVGITLDTSQPGEQSIGRELGWGFKRLQACALQSTALLNDL